MKTNTKSSALRLIPCQIHHSLTDQLKQHLHNDSRQQLNKRLDALTHDKQTSADADYTLRYTVYYMLEHMTQDTPLQLSYWH